MRRDCRATLVLIRQRSSQSSEGEVPLSCQLSSQRIGSTNTCRRATAPEQTLATSLRLVWLLWFGWCPEIFSTASLSYGHERPRLPASDLVSIDMLCRPPPLPRRDPVDVLCELHETPSSAKARLPFWRFLGLVSEALPTDLRTQSTDLPRSLSDSFFARSFHSPSKSKSVAHQFSNKVLVPFSFQPR